MFEIQKNLVSNFKAIPLSQDLHFGQHFTDHWFCSKYSQARGWYESQILPYGPMALDPAASVLHYGQALFEGMKAYRQDNGQIALFRPEFNFKRLQYGAARLCLESPPHELFMQALEQLIKVDERWVPKDEGCSLYIRPTLIGTEGFLGVRPSREMMFYIILSPVGSYYSSDRRTLKIWVEEKALRAAPGGLGAVKAGANYAASLQAGFAARSRGFDQVLWLDTAHEGIEEVGTMNVFWVFKDEIITPALNGSILAGGVRDSVIQWLLREDLPLVERRITIGEVLQRHQSGELLEAFGTGTAAVISPIGELNYQENPVIINQGEVGPLSQKLLTTITGIQRGRLADPLHWMHVLK